MVGGVVSTLANPEDYRQIRNGSDFSRRDFKDRNYLDHEATDMLQRIFGISEETLVHINRLIGATLGNIMSASLAEVDEVKNEPHDPKMKHISTLSPDVLIGTIRYCIDLILLRTFPLLGIRKKTAKEAFQQFSQEQSEHFPDNLPVSDHSLLSPEARDFIRKAAPEYFDAASESLRKFETHVYRRSEIGMQGFRDDIARLEGEDDWNIDDVKPNEVAFYSTLHPRELVQSVSDEMRNFLWPVFWKYTQLNSRQGPVIKIKRRRTVKGPRSLKKCVSIAPAPPKSARNSA